MKEIYLKNLRLEKILSRITEKVFTEEVIEQLSKRAIDTEIKDSLITDYHPVSSEYFEKALTFNIKEFGYPRATLGIGTHDIERGSSGYFYNIISKDLIKLKSYLGAESNALCMFYPTNGYIGWHHNGNAPGYNILFSYSINGDGYFEYYDNEKKETVKIQDVKGWNVKVGYYPSQMNESNRVYWHAASTKDPRLSIAFIINNRDMWINMIEAITDNNYNPDVISKQGSLLDLK